MWAQNTSIAGQRKRPARTADTGSCPLTYKRDCRRYRIHTLHTSSALWHCECVHFCLTTNTSFFHSLTRATRMHSTDTTHKHIITPTRMCDLVCALWGRRDVIRSTRDTGCPHRIPHSSGERESDAPVNHSRPRLAFCSQLMMLLYHFLWYSLYPRHPFSLFSALFTFF